MAARYWVGGGSSSNWNATGNTNWSATSGGANNASVPTSSDDVTFDSNGNSSSIISAAITVKSLTVDSSYTATITHNAVLTINGNLTLSVNYTIAGSSSIAVNATSTITSNGRAWPNNFTSSGNNAPKTLVGDLVIEGTFTHSASGNSQINLTTNESIYCNGFTQSQTLNGSLTKIVLTGGVWSSTGAFYTTIDIEFDTSTTITISGFVYKTGGTITYTSGTVASSGSTIQINTGVSFDCDGCTLGTIRTSFASPPQPITLISNLTCDTLSIQSNTTLTPTTSETITATNLVTAGGAVYCQGSALLRLGGGTWSGASRIFCPVEIIGNVTLSGGPIHDSNTITGNTGILSGTLTLQNGTTLDCDGVSFDTVIIGNTLGPIPVLTINSLFTVNVITLGITATFLGTNGFICGTFSHTGVSAFTVTLKQALTYTITNSISAYQSRTGSVILFTSNNGSVKAILTLVKGATCNVLADFTRIDASGGRPIRTFNGTVTDCDNVVSFFDLRTVALNR